MVCRIHLFLRPPKQQFRAQPTRPRPCQARQFLLAILPSLASIAVC